MVSFEFHASSSIVIIILLNVFIKKFVKSILVLLAGCGPLRGPLVLSRFSDKGTFSDKDIFRQGQIRTRTNSDKDIFSDKDILQLTGGRQYRARGQISI